MLHLRKGPVFRTYEWEQKETKAQHSVGIEPMTFQLHGMRSTAVGPPRAANYNPVSSGHKRWKWHENLLNRDVSWLTVHVVNKDKSPIAKLAPSCALKISF